MATYTITYNVTGNEWIDVNLNLNPFGGPLDNNGGPDWVNETFYYAGPVIGPFISPAYDYNHVFLGNDVGYEQVIGSGVPAGIIAVGTISGGEFGVESGGETSGVTVKAGGFLRIYSGGLDVSASINSGGQEQVRSGAIASGAQINGGYQQVLDGGSATNTTINSGGLQQVTGTATDTTVNSGGQQQVGVLGAGITISTIVNSGGSEIVLLGGTASSTTVRGGEQDVYGSAIHTEINSGGVIAVASGGTASSTIVDSGGIYNFGSALDTILNSGGFEMDRAGAQTSNTVVNDGGIEFVLSGATASNTTVHSGGTLGLQGGSLASGWTIDPGGALGIVSGYVLNNYHVSGTDLEVRSGGTASGTIIDSGGIEYVQNGGTDIGATVNSGGSLILQPAQVIQFVGGSVVLSPGAGPEIASATIINNGGFEYVSSGGTTIGSTVNSGGTEIVLSGGIASATIINGGTLELARGGSAGNGPITFEGTGGILKIDGATMPTGVISGFAPGNTIDLANTDLLSLQSAVFIEGSNHLSIVGNSSTVSLSLEGHYLDALVTQDPSGGTDIKEVTSPVDTASAVKLFNETVEKLTGLVASTLSSSPRSFAALRELFDPVFTTLGTLADANLIYQKAQQTFSDPNASPQQVLEAWSDATTEAVDLIAKAAVAGVLTAGAVVIGAGVVAAAVEGGVLGGFLLAVGVAIENLPAPVLFGTAVAGTAAYDSFWNTYLKQPVDQWITQKVIPLISPVSNVQDGYLSGATVFADDNHNGFLDSGEHSTTTDSTGFFAALTGAGPLVAFGGTDTSTGLPFKGQLSAPSGSAVISPLTTLLTDLASDPLAQQKLLSTLGLSSSLDLMTFDPIAAAKGGSSDGAATEVAGAKVYDTVEIIASALAGAGGAFSHALQDSFSALASVLDGAGINLSDKTALSALITQVAHTESVTLSQGVADTIAAVIAAGNAALDHVLQTDQPGTQLLSDASGIELVEQGAASTALTNAGLKLPKLQGTVDLFTGTNLDHLVTQAQTEAQNPSQDLGPVAFNGSATTDQNTILNGRVSAIDLLGNSITYSVDGTAPAGLTLNADGTFSFDPGSMYRYLALGESTNLSFHFKASDGQGMDSTGTENITITGLNDPPAIALSHTTATGTITELPNTTGSTAIDSVGGKIAYVDPDLTDRPTATATNDSKNETVTYQDGSGHTYALTSAQITAFENALQITAEAGNTNTGKVDWTFSITDKALDFLGAGESVTVTAPVVIDDHNGGTVTQDVVVTINGSNDNPIAVPDSNGATKGNTVSVSAAHGVLANDSDPDIHDQLTVEAVNGRTSAVGHVVEGKYGSLVLNADGSYTYRAGHDRDGWDWGHDNGVAEDVFKYTVSDGHGGLSTSTLTFVVFERGTTYLSGANTTLTAGRGPYVLDGSAGGDTLQAGRGDAVLIGGNGDTLIGGRGEDTFLFRPSFGTNTITNFNIHQDTLQFDDGTFNGLRDLLAHTTYTPSGAVISDGHGDSVTLLGITSAQLHHEGFHLIT